MATTPRTDGFVGTLEVETRGVSRIWFALTASSGGSDWVKIGAKRAWFTMNLESADRPSHMAELSLLLEAMRSRLAVRVRHDGAATSFQKEQPGDSFEATGVRVLRSGLSF
jgi:hypothetical protein